MAINFQRDDTLRLVILVGSGKVSVDEWAAAVARQLNEGIWHYGSLFDFTAVDTMVGFDEQGVFTALKELAAAHGPRGPVALVSSTPNVYDGFVAYAGCLQGLPYQTRPFRDVNQAIVWLEQELSKPRRV
jgi:hypothetical protein